MRYQVDGVDMPNLRHLVGSLKQRCNRAAARRPQYPSRGVVGIPSSSSWCM